MRRLMLYYKLTKPGIVYGNLISAMAGFVFASKLHFNLPLFFASMLGIALVIAGACVFNNYFDRDIDKKMQRTKFRSLVTGEISNTNALIFAVALALIGFSLLYFTTNLLTVLMGFVGFYFYVVMYGIWKRKSVYGTLIGSVSGSMPLVGGYTAVTNRFDLGAVFLFLLMTVWQMPHFYAIALYRLNDYKAASIPVLPVIKGIKAAKFHILFYILMFILITALMFVNKRVGVSFFIVVFSLGIYWLWFDVWGFSKIKNHTIWAKKLFHLSLIVLLGFCLMISLNSFLP